MVAVMHFGKRGALASRYARIVPVRTPCPCPRRRAFRQGCVRPV